LKESNFTPQGSLQYLRNDNFIKNAKKLITILSQGCLEYLSSYFHSIIFQHT